MNEGQVQAAGTPAKGRKYKYLIGAILLVALTIIGWAVWAGFDKNEPKPTVNQNDKKAAARHTSEIFLNYGDQAASDRNYERAISYFMISADAAIESGNYALAQAVLRECIREVPDRYVTAVVYYDLAKIARVQNDPALEKDSLQKALARTTQTNSGISTYGIEVITNRLKELP